MYENLLPIGSVVILHGGNKRLMITGRIQAKKGDSKVYEYSGCFFPEGIIDPKTMFFFDHDSIANIFFIGLQDEEELAFRKEVLGTLGELYVDDEGKISQRNT